MRSVKLVEFSAFSGTVYGGGWESIGFTPRGMILTTIGGFVRYSYSPDQAPTSVSGHRLAPGTVLSLGDFADIQNFRLTPENNPVAVSITYKAG